MNPTIIKFIQQQKAASICCVDAAGYPYCFSCFYAFDAVNGLLYFKTSATAHHTQLMLQKGQLAGTILPDKLNALVVKGVQWQGTLLQQEQALKTGAAAKYHKRYPFALAMPGHVYTVAITRIKMTDSSKGFGTKLHWQRSVQEPIA